MKFNWQNLEPAHILSWMHDNAPHMVEPLMQHLSGFAGDVLGNTPGSINGINHGQPMTNPQMQQRMGMQNQLQNNPYLNSPPLSTPITSAHDTANKFYQADGQMRPGFSQDPGGEMNFNPRAVNPYVQNIRPVQPGVMPSNIFSHLGQL